HVTFPRRSRPARQGEHKFRRKIRAIAWVFAFVPLRAVGSSPVREVTGSERKSERERGFTLLYFYKQQAARPYGRPQVQRENQSESEDLRSFIFTKLAVGSSPEREVTGAARESERERGYTL